MFKDIEIAEEYLSLAGEKQGIPKRKSSLTFDELQIYLRGIGEGGNEVRGAGEGGDEAHGAGEGGVEVVHVLLT